VLSSKRWRAGLGISDPRYATDRSLRLSPSEVPPHTPLISGSASAYSRHACRVGQTEQMARAFVEVPPRTGKNTSGSSPRHAARSIHPGVRISVTPQGYGAS